VKSFSKTTLVKVSRDYSAQYFALYSINKTYIFSYLRQTNFLVQTTFGVVSMS